MAQSSEKGSRKVTLGAIWGHFWSQKLNIATLLKHCYLPYFQPKMQFWDHLMPSGTRAYGNLSACLATEAHFFVSFGLLAGLEGANWVPEGLQKRTPNHPKSIRNPPGWSLACPRVYPPGASEAPNMYFYAYLCILLFMNAYVYLVHIYTHLCSLRICLHIHTYLCTRRR